MALLNYKKREINAKIVYYGPGLSGKTTNIQHIHTKLRPDHRGKLMTLATQTDRTLFFDFLPVELGQIRGLKTRFQIFTVPGQVFYNATRKLVLKNVDGVVFVADSDPAHLADNIESIKNLEKNLKFHNKDINDIPLIIQYNKRDLPDALPIEELESKVNLYGAGHTEASAGKGKGVLETLTAVSKLVLQRLRESQNVVRVEDDESTDFTDAAEAAPAPEEEESSEPAPAPADTEQPVHESAMEETVDIELDPDEPEEEEPEEEILLEPEDSNGPAQAQESDASEEEDLLLAPEDEKPRSAASGLSFDRVLKAEPSGNGLTLDLAFKSGDEEVTVSLDIDIKTKTVSKV